jgi:hypothetical protein
MHYGEAVFMQGQMKVRGAARRVDRKLQYGEEARGAEVRSLWRFYIP